MGTPIVLTLPPGRLVKGSLYKPTTTDAEGKPLVVKSGPNAGQPRVDYYCEIAIKKGAEQHWAHTEWGKQLWTVGSTAFPTHSQRPDFAWKVLDGDSAIPNKAGKIPNQQAGYAGHWILRMSSGFKSPLHVASNGQWVQQPQEDFANTGDFVQAQVTVNDNGSQQQAGIYINHRMFAFLGYGERIVSGPDANSAGFGMAPLPAGASAVPLGGAPLPALPGAPGAPVAPPPLVPGLPPTPGAPAAIAPPMPPAPAPAPIAPVDPLVPVPGAAHSIASLRAAQWTDDQIVGGGYATRAVAPPPAAPAMPAPLPPGSSVPAPGAPAAPIAPAMGVIPNPAFPQIPAAPATPQLTPAGVAAGGSYAAFRAQQWSDEQMRAAGYLA